MGTRWRGLLAPINKPTGDGRRMAANAFSTRPLPLPLKWQRFDETGHDTSVVIGLLDTVKIDEAAGEVWGEGELFDDQSQLPRLSEDVAEAMLLTEKKVIGPSVDAGAAEAILVEVGSDEPLTEDRLDELLMEAWDSGVDPPIEMLFTRYEIAAATLVAIPAFAEARPFELLAPALTAAVRSDGWADVPLAPLGTAWDEAAATGRMGEACGVGGPDADYACYAAGFLYVDDAADVATPQAYSWPLCDIVDDTLTIVPAAVFACADMMSPAGLSQPDMDAMMVVLEALYERMASEFDDPTIVAPWVSAAASLIASLTAACAPLPAEAFELPTLTAYTEFPQFENLGNGRRRVYGHIAPLGACHAGIPDVCRTPPLSASGWVPFHRYPVPTSAGTIATGRITSGLGKVGTGCTHRQCRGKDDHACDYASLSEAIAHHDTLRTLANVCVGVDAHGILASGVESVGLSVAEQAVLGRRRVSGDWREVGVSLELVEVLALAKEEPAFPAPTVTLREGRQYSLTASFRPPPPRPAPDGGYDATAFASTVADLVVARLAAATGPPPVAVTAAAPVHTGAMIAARMTDADADAMAIEGGESPPELHMTLGFLGQADDIPRQTQQAIIDAMRAYVATLTEPVVGEVFAVSVFNPADDAKDTAIVAGISGSELAGLQAGAMAALAAVFTAPAQYEPWAAHVSLIFTEELAYIEQLADRTGKPITFDRLRIAFAGQITDLPLPLPAVGQPTDTVAAMALEVAEALAQLDRADTAADLFAQLEAVHV